MGKPLEDLEKAGGLFWLLSEQSAKYASHEQMEQDVVHARDLMQAVVGSEHSLEKLQVMLGRLP